MVLLNEETALLAPSAPFSSSLNEEAGWTGLLSCLPILIANILPSQKIETLQAIFGDSVRTERRMLF